MNPVIVWFRNDLRLQDNAALGEAIRSGHAVIPLFLSAPQDERPWEPGGASRWWQHHALADLSAQLRDRGSRLILQTAPPDTNTGEVLCQVAKKLKAGTVYWNTRFDPTRHWSDERIKEELEDADIGVHTSNSTLLFHPSQIHNQSGKPYRVFTPMWRRSQALEVPRPHEVDLVHLQTPSRMPRGKRLKELALSPTIRWDSGLKAFWGTPTRQRGLDRLDTFQAGNYLVDRETPGLDGTSRLSPYLHHGQIGIRELWWRLSAFEPSRNQLNEGILRQLLWREFAAHLLYHFPTTAAQPLRDEFSEFPWEISEIFFEAWQEARTGYPIVDAGMRQLWQTGWMHNRVRMIAGSLLVKHLLQPWQEGARWFWETLVDADLANNTFGWQWIAGCVAPMRRPTSVSSIPSPRERSLTPMVATFAPISLSFARFPTSTSIAHGPSRHANKPRLVSLLVATTHVPS